MIGIANTENPDPVDMQLPTAQRFSSTPLTWSWQLCCLRSQQWRNTASCRRTARHNSRSPTAAPGQGDRHQPQIMGKPDGTCGGNSWGDVWQEFHPLHPARAPLVGHKLPKNCMDVRGLCVIRKTKSELFPQECDHSPHNDNGHIRGDGRRHSDRVARDRGYACHSWHFRVDHAQTFGGGYQAKVGICRRRNRQPE